MSTAPQQRQIYKQLIDTLINNCNCFCGGFLTETLAYTRERTKLTSKDGKNIHDAEGWSGGVAVFEG